MLFAVTSAPRGLTPLCTWTPQARARGPRGDVAQAMTKDEVPRGGACADRTPDAGAVGHQARAWDSRWDTAARPPRSPSDVRDVSLTSVLVVTESGSPRRAASPTVAGSNPYRAAATGVIRSGPTRAASVAAVDA